MADAPIASTAAAAAALDDNNQALRLHKAIEKGDLEKFLDLLHQPSIDLNYKHGQETLLTASIKNGNSRMAKHLIEAGCDVNLNNNRDYSPLVLCLEEAERFGVDVTLVEMLLHKGADLNAIFPYTLYTRTPLHYALKYYCRPSNSLELTSMLLYYGADVNITTGDNETPLQMAIYWTRKSCAETCEEVLLNYYDDFSNKTMAGNTVLHYAIYYKSPLIPALLERGADINWLNNKENLLDVILEIPTIETFKCIWSRINHQLFMNLNCNVLLKYLQNSKFSNCEYLERLYLMLESPVAQDLIENSIDQNRYSMGNLVGILLWSFLERKILPKERLSANYTCLSFGIKIEMEDLLYLINKYGLNEEFKALLYASDFNCYDCIEQIKYFKQWKEDFYLKGFSSFSFAKKKHVKIVNELLATSTPLESQRMLEALRKVHEFPSLLELSRNKAQKFIEQEFSVSKLYQFYDVVACLKLPQSIKDVILLEKTIYNNVTVIK